VIVTAGPGTVPLLAGVGVPLPVEPRKRLVFTFSCRETLPRFPLLIDPTGIYVRPEGEMYLCGGAPSPENDPFARDFEVEHDFFEAVLWPVLAARVPAFEAIRPGRSWAGHYDMNLFDHNAIVGPVPVERLLVAVGFSGHGLQQSPAVGRGLSELVAFGGYQSLDLSPLGYARIARGGKVDEKNVV
jgi:glycine/D-amino acid oxidase-like deaminating enzyme